MARIETGLRIAAVAAAIAVFAPEAATFVPGNSVIPPLSRSYRYAVAEGVMPKEDTLSKPQNKRVDRLKK